MNFNLKTLIIGGALLSALTASAVPAKHGLRTLRQPDGSEVAAMLAGDERAHSYITSDGLAIRRSSDGFWRYAVPNAPIAKNPDVRPAADVSFLRAHAQQLAPTTALRGLRMQAPENSLGAFRAAAPKKSRQVPSLGSPRIPILLVQYSDYKFKDSDPKATFSGFFDTDKKSARQYFIDQSNGLYTPQFDVYGPITLSRRSTYGGNDSFGYDKGVGRMVAEACQKLDSSVDFSIYDNDGDGEADVVIVLYAGDGEASSYEPDCEDSIWPCQWELSESDYGKSLSQDNTKINKFAVFNELNGSDLSKIDGVGTFCHEFSHCLDLPDFYDTEYSGHFGMSHWSLLDYGSYNDDGYTPIGYSAYEKEFMGWIEIPEARENTFYTLPVFNSLNAADDQAVKLTNPLDPDEYYIIENRARQGWDKFIPAEGLMISHVTYNAQAWEQNIVNNYSMQRMTIIPADGQLKMDSFHQDGTTYYKANEQNLRGDLWPYGGKDELTDTSSPAATVNTGSRMGKPITSMGRHADGSISFWAMKAPLPPLALPAEVKATPLSSNSLRLDWEASENPEVTYTVECRRHSDAPDVEEEELLYIDFIEAYEEDITDWTTTGFGELTWDGYRLGSSKQQGSVTSPAFSSSNPEITVLFTAMTYGNDLSSAKLSILDPKGSAIGQYTFPLSADSELYMMTFPVSANENIKVKFETVDKRKRWYLQEVMVLSGGYAVPQMPSRRAASSADPKDIQIFEGITDNFLTIGDLEEKGVYDLKLRVVPNDPTLFNPSDWSDVIICDLSEATPDGAEKILLEDQDPDAAWFTLQGVRVGKTDLLPGIYIRMSNGKSEKIIVK